ncbi:hypothetical protein FM111_02045 [Brevundimonas diminuta 3F5N]|uniref:Uncharacterized protein n=1 Tax=Brevundimonas diminuta 3F5N TaxID=1255603 RepID=A0A1R4F1U0_BREDI|nr:hypothetical protein FM111_02045 [Brevundimonas diminuta 3F5N]
MLPEPDHAIVDVQAFQAGEIFERCWIGIGLNRDNEEAWAHFMHGLC